MPGGWYRWFDGDVLAATAAILLIGLLGASGMLAVRGDDRGWLATVIMLPTLALLLVEPRGQLRRDLRRFLDVDRLGGRRLGAGGRRGPTTDCRDP
ncbi:hypothetical protein [Micromonospora sp. LOL_023]|uniref:hypothetical protein n=1 Tax=Micromonospora sp. LOL_023 TaxID=3345418 RepID=UPI003A899340